MVVKISFAEDRKCYTNVTSYEFVSNFFLVVIDDQHNSRTLTKMYPLGNIEHIQIEE